MLLEINKLYYSAELPMDKHLLQVQILLKITGVNIILEKFRENKN